MRGVEEPRGALSRAGRSCYSIRSARVGGMVEAVRGLGSCVFPRTWGVKYRVWVVPSEHSACFDEMADGIVHSLRQFGHDAELGAGSCEEERGRLVVFNAHRLESGVRLPDDAIVFNAEQVRENSTHPLWLKYLDRLRCQQVWDYSQENVARLAKLGVERVAHCSVGYYPGLEQVLRAPLAEEDVDVLFYGSLNKRREEVLAQLRARGLRVQHLFGVYGAERDAWISRSKVILNAHFYPRPIWEVFRCSLPIANGKLVVTEGGGSDAELEDLARRTCVVVDYDCLAETCETFVKDGDRRRAEAQRGREAFMKFDQVEYVRRALEAST